MKKLIFILIFVFALGCANIVDKVPKERRYTESHTEIYTKMQLMPLGNGEFMFLPMTQSRYVPEKYEILYEITYDNGNQSSRWETVNEQEFNEFAGGAEPETKR